MAKCDWCKQEMTENNETCFENKTVDYPDGEKLPSIASDEDCHDCNIKAGGKHHPGCDMERCPKCRGQLISCGCLDEDEG
jgi:hypothetical protein